MTMQAAGIAFADPSGRVLFVRRSAEGDHAGEWCLPGGGVEPGETAEDAATREAREEVGACPEGERSLVARRAANGVDFSTFVQRLPEQFEPTLNAEHTAFEWGDLGAPPQPLHPGVAAVLSAIRDGSRAMAMDKAMFVARRRPDAMAFDRGTVRRVDQDGRLHVEITNISKANVCPYKGEEIPDAEALGLDAGRVYQLLRDPAELEKAAPTFNSLPLMMEHKPSLAESHPRDIVVGTTGQNAVFSAPYLRNSLVVWDAAAIKGIEDKTQQEVSCAYRYRADMTPGTHEGVRYDGVMRDILGNHVALVAAGRAGPDVIVGDSQMKERNMHKKPPISRKAALAKGAVMALCGLQLASDAKVVGLLDGVTARNWLERKPQIVTALKPLMANDADVTGLVKLLDGLDTADADMGVTDDDPIAAMDDDPVEKILALVRGKISDEDLAAVEAAVRAMVPAAPAPGDAPLDGAAGGDPDEAQLEAELQALLAGGEGGDDPAPGKDDASVAIAPPVSPTNPDVSKVDKQAMDAAIKTATDKAEANTIARLRGIQEAERVVRPYVGELAIAQDSAEGVYKIALETMGVETKGIHPSAFRAILEARPIPGGAVPSVRVAMDSATAKSFTEKYPHAAGLRQLG